MAVIGFKRSAAIYGPIRPVQRGVGKNDAVFSICPHDRGLIEQKTFRRRATAEHHMASLLLAEATNRTRQDFQFLILGL
jgi:hypothetical protein